MNEKITNEELKAILDAAQRRNVSAQVADRAKLEADNAALQHTVTVQHIFMKYGLSIADRIDDATGVITRAAAPSDLAASEESEESAE